VVLEERMIKGWLVGDMHAVDDVSIWTLKSERLLSVSNGKKGKKKRCSPKSNAHVNFLSIFHSAYFIQKETPRLQNLKRNAEKKFKYAALS
jgi:hypothetical protein